MLTTGWRAVLVLGGVESGRSAYARSLVVGQPRQVTPVPGAGPAELARLLTAAEPQEILLVDPLDDWLTGSPAEDETLCAAVRECSAKVVLVSSDVSSAAPESPETRARLERLGAANRALADAADAVALVVAGQPMWLKGGAVGWRPPAVTSAQAAGITPDLSNLRGLPIPNDRTSADARRALAALGGFSLGALERVVAFAAGTQGEVTPAPWRQPRVLVLVGDHGGAASAGAAASADLVAQLRAGTSPLALLAGAAGAEIRLVETAAAAAIEEQPAMDDAAVEEAMAHGWRLAEQAADEGVDLLIVAGLGAGADTAAAAVAAVHTNTEPAMLLGWVRTADGKIDDPAWIRRCAAVRDAVHRVRAKSRTAARTLLAELGGPDIATATGVLLGAASRRTPVLLDGPMAVAAALVARNLAGQTRHWWLLPDHGDHPTVRRAAEVLHLEPLFDLRLALGEGATACTALPLLRSALSLAATLRTEA